VIIGNGKDGLPIILGNVDSPASPGPGPKPAEGGTTPNDKTPVTPPAPIGNLPAGNSSTTPAGGASMAADKKTSSTAPASSDKQPSSSIPLDLTDIQAILSRITEGLRPSGSATSPATGAQPKQ
jgi:hypothetical protein